MVTFNPTDPAFLENPFPFYALGRNMSPLFIENANIWSVFGYNDCANILRDTTGWQVGIGQNAPEGAPEPSMLMSNPPRHTRLRSLVSQAFTPRMVEQLEPRIYEIANELVDRVCETNEVDIVDALTYPLPVIVIAEILGVPPEDRDAFKRWSDQIVATLGSGLTPTQDSLVPQETIQEVGEYFTRMAEDRRANPKNDLMSGLVAAQVEGEKLTFEEVIQMLVLLLVAGNETTTNLIGNAIMEFEKHPDQLQKVLDDRSLLPNAIEEVLRYSSPVQATARWATRDQQVGGKTIPAGQGALVWIAAANRDPEIFANPDVFEVTRTPNRHLSFGIGIHFCLGAPLARLEAKVALDVFLQRVKNFERADDRLLPRVPTWIMRGVRELPIRYEVAA